ncbi:MAG TPA: hypothetical protein V6C97_36365 [Oculatellaceae cyanobacterium]
MRDALAERLLAKVMEWSPEEVATERRILQGMALFKYDEYQKYSPGRRFVESLAIWLQQFASIEDRRIAYQFVRSRLVYFSTSEIVHLAGVAFPDVIRPMLIEEVAKILTVPNFQVRKIVSDKEYQHALRQCLYLGLSDGARTDIFRRSTSEVNHEQMLSTYEVTNKKASGMLAWMNKGFEKDEQRKFRYLFLMDDFSASGRSYLRKEDSGEFGGKVFKVFQDINKNQLEGLVDPNTLTITILLYVATDQAIQQLSALCDEALVDKPYNCCVKACQRLEDVMKLDSGKDSEFWKLLEKYYDASIETEHTGCVKYGYADCALPIVLSHNTPNNSVYLLWAESDKVKPLFPRVSRHKRET